MAGSPSPTAPAGSRNARSSRHAQLRHLPGGSTTRGRCHRRPVAGSRAASTVSSPAHRLLLRAGPKQVPMRPPEVDAEPRARPWRCLSARPLPWRPPRGAARQQAAARELERLRMRPRHRAPAAASRGWGALRRPEAIVHDEFWGFSFSFLLRQSSCKMEMLIAICLCF
jgi:hypothetical protein